MRSADPLFTSHPDPIREPRKTRNVGGPIQAPDSLLPLVEQGVISEVVRPLLSGKEAQIYLVRSGGELRVAKIYKDAQQRSFKHRAQYTEGRKVRNSRDQRAMAKGSRYGKARDEAAWKATEVDIIYRWRDVGVRVPKPFIFTDGVLVMELITNAEGNPAPRLSDVRFSRTEAQSVFDELLREVVKMLCAGVVHGDLSDFNVLIAADGPVIIDFPQSLNAAGNQNAERILVRDVDNLNRFLARHVRGATRLPYGKEMWAAYECSELTPDFELTGKFTPAPQKTSTTSLLAEIEREAQQRRRALGIESNQPAYVFAPVTKEKVEQFTRAKREAHSKNNERGGQTSTRTRRRRRKKDGTRTDQRGTPARASTGENSTKQKEARSTSGGCRDGNAGGETRKPDRSRTSKRNRRRSRNRNRNDNPATPRNG